ncbi:MAG TPA: sigma-70 family RNA polymerase sigma factor [Opitutales bacterium]|nr:sigma-70 family RNA polymerase sigma factor [Opitutales bacterium]
MTLDAELLRRYATQGDETAFAEVVRRQTNLIYSVALRMTGGNAALAEDVTQSVFTDLARKAGPLSHHPALAGWLHTSARFAALKAMRGEQRRRARETEATIMQESTTATELDWERLQPLLDEAVGRLGEKDRAAVVLRYFQGLSHREVGETLGLNENTARKLGERALDKLRVHFARVGIVASAGLLASTLAAHSQEAAPAGLAEKITTPSLAGIVGGGILSAFSWRIFIMSTKTKVLLAVAVLAALIVSVAIGTSWHSQRERRPDKTAAATVTPSEPAVVPLVATPMLPPATSSPLPLAKPPGIPAQGVTPQSAEARALQAKAELYSIISDIIEKLAENPTYALTSHMPGQIGALQSTVDQGLANASPEAAAAIRQKTASNNAALARSVGVQIRKIQFEAMLNLVPTLNAAGDKATFTYDSATLAQISALRPDVNAKSLPHSFQFIKIKGQWYIDSGE